MKRFVLKCRRENTIDGGCLHNRKVTNLLLAITILLVGIGISYAMLPTDNLRNEPVDVLASTAQMKLRYTDCPNENTDTCADITAELAPGDSVSKNFSVTNTGTIDVLYTLYFRELYNTFVDKDLVYTLENLTTEETLISQKKLPTGRYDGNIILNGLTSAVGSTTEYRITVTFLNKDHDQSNNIDAEFSLKLGIRDNKSIIKNELMAVTEDYSEKMWAHKSNIKSVVFEKQMSSKENATYVYDISSGQDGSVMSYLVPTEEDATKYVAYIQSDGQTIANADSSYLFSYFTSVKGITGLENLNTSNVINMEGMFGDCVNLTALDLSSFDTSNVTNMEYMFGYCKSITTLDLSNFDTSNVVNMEAMFYMYDYYNSLTSFMTSLILSSKFDTSSVTDMSYMFIGCTNLTSLDTTLFETRNVIDMSYMFGYCKSLTALDLSNFDTRNVTNMAGMFMSCKSLTTLDLSNFDTSNVTDMYSMFNMYNQNDSSNSSMTSLILSSKFDTGKVTDMSCMFQNLVNLISLDVSMFNTSNVTDMSYMFGHCQSLTALDLTNFDTRNVTDMSCMFQNLVNLISLDVSMFNTSNVTGMSNMFRNCGELTELDLSSFDTSNVTNMSYMFYMYGSLSSKGKLAKLVLSQTFKTDKVTNMQSMFDCCTNLTALDLSWFNTGNVTNMRGMFSGCIGLVSINLSNFDTSKVTDMGYMFNECKSLESLNLINFDTANVTDMESMFSNCRNLTTTLTIRGTKCTKYTRMFYDAPYYSTASITLNYTEDASSLVDKMLSTKTTNYVIKGSQVA